MNLCDMVGGEDIDRKIEAEQAINKLGHIDRAVLYLWVEGYSQVEIANIFGYSREHINRLLAKMSQK